jgi:hypothetical protein
MHAVSGGHTACVKVLVAAKADVDIKDVSYARLFACPVALILCLYADYYVNIVVCNPSLIISFMGYQGD